MLAIPQRLLHSKSLISEWLPILVGILVLFIPTFFTLINGIWTKEEHAHGPIILFLSFWLMYRKWPELLYKKERTSGQTAGWVIFFIALTLYIIGRSQQILLFEIGSSVLVLMAILLIKFGYIALKIMWFPLFFLLFMIPLPGQLVSFLTMPMKMAVSYVAENILFWIDYPIARNGVVLQIQSENASSGPYHYDVSQLPAGVYFINWQVAGSWFTSKWVKIK